jgi:hypothetical protein
MTQRELQVSIEIARLTARLEYLERRLEELRLEAWTRFSDRERKR